MSTGMMVLIGVGIYMLAMLGIGIWSAKQIRNTTDYIVAGRRLGMFYSVGTLFATWFCAGTLMGSTAQAYLFGNQGAIFDPWGAGLCLIIAGLFFVRLMRRGGFVTLVDFFEVRYGQKMGFLASIVLVVAEMGWVGSLLVAFGVVLQYFSGLPLAWGITISCVVLIFYTYMGGMWSVTVTDVYQMILLILGLVIMVPFAISHIGGWEYFISHASNWSELPSFAMGPVKEGGYLGYLGLPGWIYYIGAWISIGLGSIPAQDLMQRTLSAKDEKTSVYSAYIAGILYLTVGLIPIMLGIVMFEVDPALSIPQTEMILPMLAVKFLPPIIMVIFVCGVIAATMSSADSALLAASSIIGFNVVRHFKPDASDQTKLRITRLCVPIVALVSLFLALFAETIYFLMVIAWSIILIGLMAPYAAGYFWKKANQSGAVTALLGGFASWIVFILLYLPMTKDANIGVVEAGVPYMDWAIWDAVYIGSVPAFIVSIVLLVVVSLATQKSDKPLLLADVDGKPLKLVNWTGWGFKKKVPGEGIDVGAAK